MTLQLASSQFSPRLLRTLTIDVHLWGSRDCHGGADPQVVDRLLRLLGELAWRFPPHQRGVVHAQLERLVATVGQQDVDPEERARSDRAARRVATTLDPLF